MEDFNTILFNAGTAANLAGDKWLNEHPNGDPCCGMAYIELKDRRAKFAKFLKKQSKHGQVYSVFIEHKYRGRQDWTLNEVCINAAYQYLKEQGITGITFKSRID